MLVCAYKLFQILPFLSMSWHSASIIEVASEAKDSYWSLQNHMHVMDRRKEIIWKARGTTPKFSSFKKILSLKSCPAMSVHFISSTLSHCHTYLQGRLNSVFFYLVTVSHSFTKEGWDATGNLCHNCFSAL